MSMPGVLIPSQLHPPVANRPHCKCRCVGTCANAHVAGVERYVINAVRNGSTLCIAGKVVSIHDIRFAAPPGTFVVKVADQFTVFGINADYRSSVCLRHRPHPSENLKLLVSIRMSGPGQAFHVGSQRIPCFLQQPTDGSIADSPKLIGQSSQRTFHILPLACRVASGFRFYQLLQVLFDRSVIFSTGGRPAPGRRTRAN